MTDDPRTTLPHRNSPWREPAEELLDGGYALNAWEEEFCGSFLGRDFDTPTPRMQAVFRRLADDYGLECPDD